MTIHAPIPDFAAARAAMVDAQLRPQGVDYPPVLEAMAEVPRELFVADEARAIAYADRAVPIGEGRMLSAPAVLGLLLTELAPLAGERALVVACGSGYSAAVLQRIGLEVTGLESSSELAGRAQAMGIEVVEGPLENGFKKGAPYQLILIDGAVETIPEAIIAQLTPDGRLATALVEQGICRLAIGRRAGNGFGIRTLADAGVAALPGFARARAFTF